MVRAHNHETAIMMAETLNGMSGSISVSPNEYRYLRKVSTNRTKRTNALVLRSATHRTAGKVGNLGHLHIP